MDGPLPPETRIKIPSPTRIGSSLARVACLLSEELYSGYWYSGANQSTVSWWTHNMPSRGILSNGETLTSIVLECLGCVLVFLVVVSLNWMSCVVLCYVFLRMRGCVELCYVLWREDVLSWVQVVLCVAMRGCVELCCGMMTLFLSRASYLLITLIPTQTQAFIIRFWQNHNMLEEQCVL